MATRETAASAYNLESIQSFRWGEDDDKIREFAKAGSGSGLVVANQLQSPRQRELITALQPREFIFYDNGLSSYVDHKVDMERWIETLPNCQRFAAYLSYANEFGIPAYLHAFDTASLAPSVLARSAQLVCNAFLTEKDLLPAGAAVILGTSFDRTNILSASEEQALHQHLAKLVRERHEGPIFFKPHPRAGDVYLTEADDVSPLSTELPIEAYVSSADGTAYSFSSTALFSLPAMFGWKAHRVQHELMDKVFTSRPQLAKMKILQPSIILERS
ncbi:MAG: hypothetical protein CMF04_06520 [Hyphomonas sp.]|nr:hypothetical protein [Hyphomonas sp.]